MQSSKRGTRGPVALALLLLSLPLAACGREPASRAPLTVFAASSLIDVLPKVARAWEADGGAEVRFSFGATSKLVPQVIEGAPADAVVGADLPWIERLEAEGKAEPGTRVVLARNDLVFVVPAGTAPAPGSAADLPGPLHRIALAGEHVPAGRYARAALTHAGVWAAVAPRVVPGEDVRLALRWVAGGDADGGVVYATDARWEPRVKVAFVFPAGSHPPIVYPATTVKGAARAAEAARFLDFCCGPKARPIFDRYGFGPATP